MIEHINIKDDNNFRNRFNTVYDREINRQQTLAAIAAGGDRAGGDIFRKGTKGKNKQKNQIRNSSTIHFNDW